MQNPPVGFIQLVPQLFLPVLGPLQLASRFRETAAPCGLVFLWQLHALTSPLRFLSSRLCQDVLRACSILLVRFALVKILVGIDSARSLKLSSSLPFLPGSLLQVLARSSLASQSCENNKNKEDSQEPHGRSPGPTDLGQYRCAGLGEYFASKLFYNKFTGACDASWTLRDREQGA